ncbi:MAG: hypothetical protein ABSB26_06755 [Nitrososphaerales archaeon]|jgi:hypothetical protein
MLKRHKKNFPTEFWITVKRLEEHIRQLQAIEEKVTEPIDKIRAIAQIVEVEVELFKIKVEGVKAWKATQELEDLR